MTISSETARSGPYSGNDSTDVFAYAFKVTDQSHLVVTLTVTATGVETVQTITTHYTVSGVGDEGGGNVTMVTAPATGETLTITRTVTKSQTTDLENRGAVQPSVLETALDRNVQMTQDLSELQTRSMTFPVSDSSPTVTLPTATLRANYVLGFDSSGDIEMQVGTGTNSSVDINGGAIDGTTIGGTTPAAGTFTTLNATGGGALTGTWSDLGTVTTVAINGGTITGITDLAVADGGTGASTLTDGGVLLGSGTDAITAMAVLADGEMIVGDGTTDPVAESGATLRTSIGVGTGDSPTFTDLTLSGDLTVNGTTTTINTTNVVTSDFLIELNNTAASNANDMGIVMERGSTGDNAFMGWDESADAFTVGTTTATGASSGNLTVTVSPFNAGVITGTTIEATGDTSAGDNAAMGYTATEGLILTGQGSSYDVVIKNDADANVMQVATGTQVATFPGSVALATGATVTGIADEDDMTSDSATLLSTQQAIKAYVDTEIAANVPENGVKFAFESTTTDADQGAGKVWLNHATPSSATVLYIDDVEAGSVSVNAWVDTFDDVSNATTKGTIYIASYGTTNAILVYNVTGAVTSASTYSKIGVTHVLTVGTISDGDDIGLTFVTAGQDGSGTMNDVVDDTTPQLGGELDGQDNTVSKVNLKDYGEVTNALGSVSGAQTVDIENGNVISVTPTGAITWTFSNPTASDEGCGFTLVMTDGDAGAQTWPASVDWPSGTAPALGSNVDVLVFITIDGGTTWHGALALADSQ